MKKITEKTKDIIQTHTKQTQALLEKEWKKIELELKSNWFRQMGSASAI